MVVLTMLNLASLSRVASAIVAKPDRLGPEASTRRSMSAEPRCSATKVSRSSFHSATLTFEPVRLRRTCTRMWTLKVFDFVVGFA